MKLTAILIAAFATTASANALNVVPQVTLAEFAFATLPIAQTGSDQHKTLAPACSKARFFSALSSSQPAGSDCNLHGEW